jgi:succinate dehydrogenase/fumarate reductase cytochrome b subunit
MSPDDRTVALVLGWCDLYTSGLPTDIAADRRDELVSDLHDHRAAATTAGRSTIARDIAVRALLGVPADLSWRTYQLRIARSAREPEVAMTARAPLDGWTRTAYALGSSVALWCAVVGVGMLFDARNAAAGSEDFTWRIWLGGAGLVMLAVSIHGLLGLRTHPTRASVELAVAAMVTTVWMMWAAPVVLAGVALTAFFAAYAVHSRRAARAEVAAA